MGVCTGSVLYKFDNFIEIVSKYPQQQEGVRIERLQIEVDKFSVSRAHQLDHTYDVNLVSPASFLVAEPNQIIIFEQKKELITNRSRIHESLKNVIFDKMLVQSEMKNLNYLIILDPLCSQNHKQTILHIIIQCLLNVDLTSHNSSQKKFAVYFDQNFIKSLQQTNLIAHIRRFHIPRKN